MDHCNQAPYYFIEGDWVNRMVYVEPHKMEAVHKNADGEWKSVANPQTKV